MRVGCLLVACAVTSTARADQKIEGAAKPAAETAKTPKPAKPADAPKPRSKPPDPKAAEKAADAALRALTADPQLGDADRIDGDELKGMVTFTFDDGPEPETTPAVIDALEKYNIPATFFVVTRRLVGKLGEKPREILARQLEAGFTVASHSVSHPSLRGASATTFAKEIDQSIRTLAKEADRPIGMFRPPFGAFDQRGRAWLKKRGLTEVRWSIDTLDWQARNAERLRKKVMSMILAQDGGVVLMHDVKPITAEVIGLVLDDLEAENCKRLGDHKELIVPVSIHYFVRDKKKTRELPEDVKKRTEAYKTGLPARCAARPKPVEPPKPEPAKAASKSAPKPGHPPSRQVQVAPVKPVPKR